MDTVSIIIMAIEGVVILSLCVLWGKAIYTKYQNKENLTFDEIVQLTKDLSQLASNTVETLDIFTLKRSDFGTDEEYRDYIIKNLVQDFDNLIFTINPDHEDTAGVYSRLSYDDKVKIIDSFVDNLPLDVTGFIKDLDEVIDDMGESDETTDMVDMSEYL